MATPRLPGPLQLTPSLPFVGRSEELAVLDRLRSEAAREGRRVALVQGEPGSGKTRLAREAAQRAAEAGASVLYGACDAALSSPYQAFVEALEQLADRAPSAISEVAGGPRGGELARLLPHLADRLPAAPATVAGDPGGGRHRLHGAVADVLAAHAREQPVVLVLDDLHWADAPTLLLLRHLTRTAAALRLLILATFRQVEAEAAPDLADALAELHRHDGVLRIPLPGLHPPEIAEFLQRLVPGARGLDRLSGALSDLTGGNAFLVGELAQHLADAGMLAGDAAPDGALDRIGIPQGVRDVVGQRLARLSPATREVLELAAVSGRAVQLAVLAAAATLDEASLLTALDDAARSHMLEEVPGARIAYRFRHELLRRAVSDRLPSARRAALHLRVGNALEEVHGAGQERAAGDLARHFAAAAGLGGGDRAVHYALLAAGAAMRSFAYEDAARRLQGALDLGIDDSATRARTLCRLGTALHRAGRAPQALESYASAAALARAIPDAALLAEAAIGFENACWRPGIGDVRSVELLEEAAAAVAADDSPLRARILAGLSRALAYRGEHEAAAERWREALQMARRVGDRRSLAVTLFHAAWTRGAQRPAAVLASLTEARDLLRELGEDDLRHETEGFRLSLVLESYEIEALRRELPAFRAEVERTGQPFYLHVFSYMSSTLAVCDGRFDEAEQMAARALELSRQFDEDAAAIHGIQMFTLRRERGRLAEAAPVIRAIAGRDGGGAWGPALAVLLAELGMLDEAREELERLSAGDFARVPRGGLWLGGLTYMADACALVDEPRLAARVYGELLRLEGKNVVIGQGVACYGAADRFLGALATTMGDADAAVRHLEAALELNGRLQSPTWLAHTRYEYARALLRRGERDRARPLLAAARETARRTGMRALAGRVERVGVPELPDGLSAREVQVLRLIAGGLSNREIGDALTISQHTAANHVRSILLKTGCGNRTEAASYAHRNRLLEPRPV